MIQSTSRLLASGLLASTALIAFGAAPAVADPQKGTVVDVVCDDGNTYTMVARGAANWNAQLDTDSNSAFHLTNYSITYEVTAPDGTVEIFGPDTLVKGGNDREHKDLLDCTFSFDIAFPDGSTAHISGPATGWLTPSGT